MTTPFALSKKPANIANNKRELIKIIDHFIKELKSGAVIPAHSDPEYIINVFCVPKKDSKTGEKTKLRVVRHGSYATPGTTSINEWINKDKCKMPSLPNLKDYVSHLIDKEWMALRDLQDAFRQIGLASKDIGYLGYSLFGLKFLDVKQPYGISSAAANCQSFANIIIWILDNKKVPTDLKQKIIVHIDDFCMAAKTEKQAITLQDLFDELCDELGVAVSHDKDVDATQKAVVYGFLFDLKNKTVGIPDDKLQKLTTFIKSTLDIGIITGRALDALCGKIMHWSQLFKPAKALCYNMIFYLYQRIRIIPNYKTECFYLPPCIVQDLQFWLKYAKVIKEVPMATIINQPSIQLFGSSDACDYGGGFCIREKWSYYKFTNTHRVTLHIDQKEAHVVIMLLHNLRHFLTGKRITLFIDNAVLYWAMVRHWAAQRMMPCIYEICLIMMRYRIAVWFEWIPTECNKLADSLSRFDMHTFHKWVQLHRIQVEPHPLRLQYINDFEMIHLPK